MRRLILLALLPALAHADGIIMCKSAAAVADGDALGKCPIADRPCVTSITPGTLVRTHVDPNQTHIWRKWQSLADNGPVRGCASWTTKSVLAPQITVSGTQTPPSPPTPKIVAVNNLLWWTPVEGATGYRVYQGTKPGVYGEPVAVTTTRYPLKGHVPGEYYFAVSAVLSDGESVKVAAVEPYEVLPIESKVWTCTTPVAKQVGEVTQMSYSCK